MISTKVSEMDWCAGATARARVEVSSSGLCERGREHV